MLEHQIPLQNYSIKLKPAESYNTSSNQGKYSHEAKTDIRFHSVLSICFQTHRYKQRKCWGTSLVDNSCFSCFSRSSCLISRPSEKSRMRCPDLRGRESWDWAEQNSLYKKNSPHKVGEETFVRMGARWRK